MKERAVPAQHDEDVDLVREVRLRYAARAVDGAGVLLGQNAGRALHCEPRHEIARDLVRLGLAALEQETDPLHDPMA